MAGYEPVGWKNYPDKTTSISAENLNHMDEGITKLDTEKLNIDKITQSTAVNQDGYALDAREKNASISGTMANQISELNTNFINKLNGCVLKHDAITLTSNELVTTFKECCAQLKSKEKGIYMFEFLITSVDRVQMLVTWSNDVNTSHGMIQTYNKAFFINASEARFVGIERVQ